MTGNVLVLTDRELMIALSELSVQIRDAMEFTSTTSWLVRLPPFEIFVAWQDKAMVYTVSNAQTLERRSIISGVGPSENGPVST